MTTKYDLELFVVGGSARAKHAEDNLRRFCDAAIPGSYSLRVTDVLENAEAADAANIIATPAVLRHAPLPRRMIVGDLSRRDALAHGLGLDPDAHDSEGSTP